MVDKGNVAMIVQALELAQPCLENSHLFSVARSLCASLVAFRSQAVDSLVVQLEYNIRAEEQGQTLDEALLYRENSHVIDERLESNLPFRKVPMLVDRYPINRGHIGVESAGFVSRWKLPA